MRINEILTEKPVSSTWITDLSYNRRTKTLTMSLSNGRSYTVPNVTRSLFDTWTKTPSKGRFFHNNIKDRYTISRIR